ncbi:MAG: glycerol-3-phosphate 1-O-acyltransferase PlsY [Bacteroidota bacterium]
MITPLNILGLIVAYLLGSIPTAVWIGKLFYNKDVREYGSGNAGATNTFRVLGRSAGIPVLIIDVLKGSISILLVGLISDIPSNSDAFINLQLAFGISAFIGHLFPVFAEFRGGKGVATMLGIVLALNFPSALLAILVFLVIFILSGYVSLSSISAALSFPIFVLAILKTDYPTMVIFSLMVSILMLITHQKNIERLLKKEESKMFSFKKKAI